jgi:hypothetical protein
MDGVIGNWWRQGMIGGRAVCSIHGKRLAGRVLNRTHLCKRGNVCF